MGAARRRGRYGWLLDDLCLVDLGYFLVLDIRGFWSGFIGYNVVRVKG